MGRRRFQDPALIKTARGYKIRYRHYFLDGTHDERYKHFDGLGKREAERARSEFLAVINRPEEILPSQEKFGVVLDQFLATLTAADVSLRNYRSAIERWLKPRWGNTRMCDFRQMDIEAWIATIAKEMGEHRLKFIKAVFRQVWKSALRWGFTRLADPMGLAPRRIGRPKPGRNHVLMTDEQARRVMAALDGEARLISQIMMFTGMRVGEALALTWRDVEADEVRVARTVEQHTNRVLEAVKTPKSRRVIPIGQLRPMLTRPDGAKPEDRIYPHSYHRLIEQLRSAAKEVGCWYKGFGAHSFRRWFNTEFRKEGGSVELAMKQLGHTTGAMNDVYMLDSQVAERQRIAALIVGKVSVN